ncbi:MAG: tRNA (N6-threonylcarbamoyladenosine(37)-N6)-methyltransferase TrmO [Pseudonocardia sp.]
MDHNLCRTRLARPRAIALRVGHPAPRKDPTVHAAFHPPAGIPVIGHVRSARTDPATTPIQSLRNPAEEAAVEMLPDYAAGLDGLAEFDHAWLLTWLGGAPPPAEDLRVVPFLLGHTGERVGVFATRHPARPNPIGLSVVRLLRIEGHHLHFAGVDLCDGTPVLDVKPWEQHLDIPRYAEGPDAVAAIRGGWYHRSGAPGRTQVLPHEPDRRP